jgi:hypothetical protein
MSGPVLDVLLGYASNKRIICKRRAYFLFKPACNIKYDPAHTNSMLGQKGLLNMAVNAEQEINRELTQNGKIGPVHTNIGGRL